MAPDWTPRLAVFTLDSTRDSTGELEGTGTLEYVEFVNNAQPRGPLRVRFLETVPAAAADRWEAVGGGVAFVQRSAGMKHVRLEGSRLAGLPGAGFRWREGFPPNVDATMLILILPTGYTCAQAAPWPAGAKSFGDKVALYWVIHDKGGFPAEITFHVSPMAEPQPAEVRRLNAGVPLMPPQPRDLEVDSSAKEMPVSLTSPQRKQLRDALLDAFRNPNSLRRVARYGLDQNLDAIATGNLMDLVDGLIDWADERDKIPDLVRGALEENADNPRLKACASLLAGDPGAAAPPPLPVAGSGTPQAAVRSPAESAPAVQPPPTQGPIIPPASADPPPISIADKDRLRAIVQNVFTMRLPDAPSRIGLLSAAELSQIWIGGFEWNRPAVQAAVQLIDAATAQGFPLQEGRRGYTILGAVLDQILAQQYVGFAEGQYLASVIARYRLINTARAGVTVSPLLQALGQYVPQLPGEAEAAVRALVGFNDFIDATWLDQGAAACRAVCRVETPSEYGTGFLVGPDLLLTNWHVVQSIFDAPALAPQVELRFGYKRRPDGSVDEQGDVYHLADTWIVDMSPNTPDGLDYALLRLRDPAGDDAVGTQKRGWLRPVPHTFRHGEDLYIIQHPQLGPPGGQTAPLKVVLAPNAVGGETPGRKRVTYAVNTQSGSSGSPCFTRAWELVALHHSARDAASNEGIPLDTICAQGGVRAALGL